MKKLYLITILIFILLLSGVYGLKIENLISPSFTIVKQDYMQNYINYDFEIINATHVMVNYTLTDEGISIFEIFRDCSSLDNDKCIEGKVNKSKHLYKDGKTKKYKVDDFLEEKFKDKDKSKLVDDIAELKLNKFPKESIIGNIEFLGEIDPINYKKSYIHLIFPDGVLNINHAKFKFGFDTIIVDFNGSTATRINYSNAGDMAMTLSTVNQNQWLKLPVYSVINNATILLRGISGYNRVYTVLDEFDDASFDAGIWDSFTEPEHSLTEAGESVTYSCNYADTDDSKESEFISSSDQHDDTKNFTFATQLDMTSTYSAGGGQSNTIYYQVVLNNGTNNQTLWEKQHGCSDACSSSSHFNITLKFVYNESDDKYYIYNATTGLLLDVKAITMTGDYYIKYRFRTDGPASGVVTVDWIIYGVGKRTQSYQTYWQDWIINESMNYERLRLRVGDTSVFNQYVDNETWNSIDHTSTLRTEFNTGACDCTYCILDGNYCYVRYEILRTQTRPPAEWLNLSVDVNVTQSNLNVTIYDADTLEKINWTNITTQLVGSIFQLEETDDDAIAEFTFPFNATQSDSVSLRAFQTDTPRDYPLTIRNITVGSGENYSIDLYLTNISDTDAVKLVTFRVVDSNRNRVEDALIQVYKQNPATNEYLEITDLTTNQNGEATTYLIKNTAFYYFIIEYGDEVVYTSRNPVPITDNDDTIIFTINLEEGFTDLYDTIFNNVSLSFVRTTNFTGVFRTTYSYSSTVEICTDIYISNATLNHNQSLCYNGTSGLFDSTFLNASNRTLFTAYTFVDLKDGYGFQFVESASAIIGEGEQLFRSFGSEGILLPVVAIITGAFGFMGSPIIGLLIMMIIFIIIFMLGVTTIQGTALSLILALAIFTIVTYSKK